MINVIGVTDRSLLMQLLWSTDPGAQNAILLVLAFAFLAVVMVYGPALLRLFRIALLERSARSAIQLDERSIEEHRKEMAAAFLDSPLADQWEEFAQRWHGAQTDGPQERSAVRLIDVLEDHPLLPAGIVRSLLPALPGLFLAVGITGTFVGLTLAISEGALIADGADRALLFTQLTAQVALALHTSLWGLLLAIFGIVIGRVLEGSYDRYAELLDRQVERAFGSISAGELANLTIRAQRETLEQLGTELTRFTVELTERLDRGLQRIEHSTATAANLVSEEQRSVLKSVVRELSLQVQQGVEHHLGALHHVLDQAVVHQGAVTGGLAQAFEQMSENSRVHSRVTEALEHAAESVQDAAGSIHRSAEDFRPVLEGLRETGDTMERTAGTMETTQRVVARGADGVRVSIENASAAMNEQRSFTETALGEIRATLELLSMGLGESLQRALHSVDDTLEHTVGRLRDTIHESNDTIDRMTVPVRAAEGTSRELHTALERVRSEITGLGDWLGQTAKPLRTSLTHLEDKTGDFARALIESGEQAQAVDKTMDALRGEIHEEGRRFRASVQELGRFLAQNAEALRALERTTAEGAERMGRDVLPELEAELDLLDPPVSGPPARDPIVDATAAGTPQASPPEAPSREPSQVEPSVQAEQPADSVAGATAPAPAPQREPDSAVPPELANATSRPIPGGSPAYEPDGKAGGDRIEADRTVVADPIEAFATETKSEAALASGRRLGPDPYTRMGTDRAGQAHELVRKRQALGATASDPPPELGAGQRPTFNGSDDLTLSGLLGKRSATADPPASPPSAPASSPDPTSESDDEPADPGEEPGSEATSPSATPRTWRLLGRE